LPDSYAGEYFAIAEWAAGIALFLPVPGFRGSLALYLDADFRIVPGWVSVVYYRSLDRDTDCQWIVLAHCAGG